MNRQHIYRGKRLDYGTFVEGDLFYRNDTPCIMLATDIDGGFDWVEVHPDTVDEFTCLTDRNGKNIYEGDIVKIDGKYTRYVVYSGEHTAFCAMRYIDKQQSEFTGTLGDGYDNYKRQYEVVGNIYDNPELLEGAKL